MSEWQAAHAAFVSCSLRRWRVETPGLTSGGGRHVRRAATAAPGRRAARARTCRGRSAELSSGLACIARNAGSVSRPEAVPLGVLRRLERCRRPAAWRVVRRERRRLAVHEHRRRRQQRLELAALVVQHVVKKACACVPIDACSVGTPFHSGYIVGVLDDVGRGRAAAIHAARNCAPAPGAFGSLSIRGSCADDVVGRREPAAPRPPARARRPASCSRGRTTGAPRPRSPRA